MLRELVNYLSNPVFFFTGAVVLWVLLMKYPHVWTRPKVIFGILIGSLVFLGWSFGDPNFYREATKPDNVPIWLMTYGVGFFFWLSMRRGIINDELMAKGEPSLEARESKKRVYTWPDLVYSELICMVAFTAFLLLWALTLKSPLEDPANTGITPPIAKAPWYFLGLQEILVYFDPWIAGVVLPGLIVLGLVAMPYFDFNPKGNGYYTVKDRYFALWSWGFGFVVLWIALIFLGTFMRGPGWNFFGPFEMWDSHKVVAMNNINLSEIIWVKMFNMGLPKNILIRESIGIFIVAFYLLALPYFFLQGSKPTEKCLKKIVGVLPMPSKWKTSFNQSFSLGFFTEVYEKVGFVRFHLFLQLFLIMFSVPIKMYLRWGFNLKYIVAIPEYMFNI